MQWVNQRRAGIAIASAFLLGITAGVLLVNGIYPAVADSGVTAEGPTDTAIAALFVELVKGGGMPAVFALAAWQVSRFFAKCGDPVVKWVERIEKSGIPLDVRVTVITKAAPNVD